MATFSKKKTFIRNYQSALEEGNRKHLYISSNSIIKEVSELMNETAEKVRLDEKNVLFSFYENKKTIKNSEDLVSTANLINDSFEKYLDIYGTKKLLTLLKEDDFEPGYKSRAYGLLENYLTENSQVTKNWINKIYIENTEKSHILLGILNLLKEFDYELVYPQAQTIAISSFSHKDIMIKEMAVRCFEKWEDLSSIKVLKNYELNVDWIEDYLNQVIEDLTL